MHDFAFHFCRTHILLWKKKNWEKRFNSTHEKKIRITLDIVCYKMCMFQQEKKNWTRIVENKKNWLNVLGTQAKNTFNISNTGRIWFSIVDKNDNRIRTKKLRQKKNVFKRKTIEKNSERKHHPTSSVIVCALSTSSIENEKIRFGKNDGLTHTLHYIISLNWFYCLLSHHFFCCFFVFLTSLLYAFVCSHFIALFCHCSLHLQILLTKYTKNK